MAAATASTSKPTPPTAPRRRLLRDRVSASAAVASVELRTSSQPSMILLDVMEGLPGRGRGGGGRGREMCRLNDRGQQRPKPARLLARKGECRGEGRHLSKAMPVGFVCEPDTPALGDEGIRQPLGKLAATLRLRLRHASAVKMGVP